MLTRVVAVFDEGTRFAAEAPHREQDRSGGWGLFLIDRIADRWGITRAANYTLYYCTALDLCPGP